MSTETSVEQTASAPAPAETAAPAPADEAKELELGSTDTPADAADTGEPESEEKKRNKVTAKQRINELTGKNWELKRVLSDKDKRIQELEGKLQPQEPVKPKLADFGSDADYETAMDRYYQQ
ncbi:MAG TPA: hypothetical protein VEF04_10085, partial [Blastocatellia bacterium]|nr:hypothetical protein [Blastocatellia bacterium]